MKKTILLTLFCVILSNCEIKTRETVAQKTTENDFDKFYGGIYDSNNFGYQYHIEEHEGMVYGIWSKKQQTTQTGYAVAVVNIIKDALEVELLKLQISDLHQKLHPNP